MNSKIKKDIHSNLDLVILLLIVFSSYILCYISKSSVPGLVWHVGLYMVLFGHRKMSSKSMYIKMTLLSIVISAIVCMINNNYLIFVVGSTIYTLIYNTLGIITFKYKVRMFNGLISALMLIIIAGSALSTLYKYYDDNPLNIAINIVSKGNDYVVLENNWDSFIENFASLNTFETVVASNDEVYTIEYKWITSTDEHNYIIKFINADTNEELYTFRTNVPLEDWTQFETGSVN